MSEIVFAVSDHPNADDLKTIEDGLSAFNRKQRGHEREFSCCLARVGLEICAGVTGSRTGKKFHIKHLWVEEGRRSQGLGRKLIQKIEDVAKAKHCSDVFVDTMDFQAPEFYEKLGYVEVARVPGFYSGHDRIFFMKVLA